MTLTVCFSWPVLTPPAASAPPTCRPQRLKALSAIVCPTFAPVRIDWTSDTCMAVVATVWISSTCVAAVVTVCTSSTCTACPARDVTVEGAVRGTSDADALTGPYPPLSGRLTASELCADTRTWYSIPLRRLGISYESGRKPLRKSSVTAVFLVPAV